MSHPLSVTFKHESKSSQLWALLTLLPIKIVIIIPHIIIFFVLGIIAEILAAVGIVITLFAGEYPKMIENFVIGIMRWAWRVNSYLYCMTDKYPPFKMESVSDFPADLKFEHQEKSSRLWVLFTIIPVKFFILIPHFVVLFVMTLLAAFAIFFGIFAVLFTGKYPQSFENLIVTMQNYSMRIFVYLACMTDKYPSIDWKK